MKQKKPIPTNGWVRYWISGKGGHGYKKWKWVYLSWASHEDKESVKEHIIHNLESWAIYAEYYSMEWVISKTALPPRDVIKKALTAKRNAIQNIEYSVRALENQLRLREKAA